MSLHVNHPHVVLLHRRTPGKTLQNIRASGTPGGTLKNIEAGVHIEDESIPQTVYAGIATKSQVS